MNFRSLLISASALAALAHCADVASPEDETPPSCTSNCESAMDAGGEVEPEPTLDASVPATASSEIVINEICARGVDYLELANTSQTAQPLGGLVLSDSEDDGGVKLEDGLRLPEGAMLGAGGHLLVVLGANDAGETSDCLDAGVDRCYAATWKVSNSRGERVHLLAADGGTLQAVDYPADGAPSGLSYGRNPDGTGPFGPTLRTPGRRNVP